LWWFTIVAAGVPLALVSGLAVRRGYIGHLVVLAVATLTTAALYLAFPLGFTPKSQPRLTGLGRFEHDHHLLGIGILLIPTLILLANELRWEHGVTPDPDRDDPTLRSLFGLIPRSYLVAGALLLVVCVWLAGTNGAGLLLGLGLVLTGFALFLWRTDRSTVRSVRRDLETTEKS
ncbi:MAG: hypothetical protein ACRDL7_02585, partial [Gaiellaceae bacterium]